MLFRSEIRVNGKKPQKKSLKGLFKDYEEARNYVRKFLRSLKLNRNLAANGYSILKVA